MKKRIFSIGFFASICFYSNPATQSAFATGAEDFCYQVYVYHYGADVILDKYEAEFRSDSFDRLLQSANELKKLPIHINFFKEKITYYYNKPCEKGLEELETMIARHNAYFKGKIWLERAETYDRWEAECVMQNPPVKECPGWRKLR